ncbi:MAG: TIGR02391 family protein [Sulfuricaulis sp.]|uniref:TIGR02391 family protein n=1 Tax=Sulfuricaulis sp. TaxID=2003553 RepID=UPI0034A26816
MNVRHTDEAKKSIGVSTLELLKTIFEQSSGLPPGVGATRFRAKYPKWMDELHSMGHSSILLKPDFTKDTYRVSAYVLPLIESQHASELLACMEAVYKYLRKYYDEHLLQPIRANQLIETAGIEYTLLLESLCYMRDVDGWWSGLGNDFPLETSSTIVVNERVLKYDSFSELISRVYENTYVIPARYPGGLTWVDQFDESLVQSNHPEQEVRNTTDIIAIEILIHPLIQKSSLKLFLDGHLREAVLNSIVAVFDLIRDRTGLKEDGDRLIGKAFSLDDPFLVLSELATESGANDQKGFMQIFKGAYQGIRNTKAHRLEHDLTEHKAAQYLVFASLLARRVDEASLMKRTDP